MTTPIKARVLKWIGVHTW